MTSAKHSVLHLCVEMIMREEGYSEKVRRCPRGYPTIAYGWKLGPVSAPLEHFKYMKVSRSIARRLIQEAVLESYMFLIESSHKPAKIFKNLNLARQAVFLSIAYQMGNHELHKFTQALIALEQNNFEKASEEMLNSHWGRIDCERSARLARQMQTGEWWYLRKNILNKLPCLDSSAKKLYKGVF